MIATYLAAMRRYATFAGRAPRSEYWWFKLCLAVLLFATLVIDRIADDPESAGALASLVILAHLLPNIALDVRRLHDLDRSGWFALVNLVPLVGPIVLIVWCCQPGTRGGNQFGSDPLPVGIPAKGIRTFTAAAGNVVADIERLAGLRAGGSLSEAEFGTLKAQVMARDTQV